MWIREGGLLEAFPQISFLEWTSAALLIDALATNLLTILQDHSLIFLLDTSVFPQCNSSPLHEYRDISLPEIATLHLPAALASKANDEGCWEL